MGLEKLKHGGDLDRAVAALRAAGRTVVFTNGCFDLLHPGHIRYLRAARRLGGALLVAVNTDASIRRLKGPSRPVQPEGDRAEILCALEMVDLVTLFDEDTPLDLIRRLLPDVLAKGGDWPVERIVGHAEVLANGGRVFSLPFEEGFSSSSLIDGAR
ncbi:MAG: D-glycero-beta-D-manno-heptose 1-phosphate adenylyltransferase [Acidobacteria bacterium]|nr:D-glycero-beta-D-manno-heptose 1-phosphate adenylyltransferase [Acidobacteriota bacterium]